MRAAGLLAAWLAAWLTAGPGRAEEPGAEERLAAGAAPCVRGAGRLAGWLAAWLTEGPGRAEEAGTPVEGTAVAGAA